MPSLYTLTSEFLEVVSQLEEMDLDQETFQDTLDSIQAPLEDKVENIVKYMKSLEALADAKKLEAKRLSESASLDLKKAERFKQYMADNLKAANIQKMQAGVFALGFRKGSEAVVVDESKVPTHVSTIVKSFALRVPQPDKVLGKAELKKILKENPEIKIPGVSIVKNPDSLVIK